MNFKSAVLKFAEMEGFGFGFLIKSKKLIQTF